MVDLESPPPRLRGQLSRFGVEVRAGLYVGSSSGKTRDQIWNLVVTLRDRETSAVMVFDSRRSQGFEVRTLGPNRREIVDIDGLSLARFLPPKTPPGPPVPPPADCPLDVDPGFLEEP